MDGLPCPFQRDRTHWRNLSPQSQRQDSNRALERVAVRQDSRLAMLSQSPLKKDQAELAHCLLGHRVPPLFSCETKARRGGAVSCWTSSCSTKRPTGVFRDQALTQPTLRVRAVEEKKGHKSNYISKCIPEKVRMGIYFLKSKDWPEAAGTVAKAAVKWGETGPVFPTDIDLK